MESLYYVICWACHRKCKHCYDDRFRPYVRNALEDVVVEAERNAPRIVDNLPDRMTYLDINEPLPDGRLPEKTGRIILSGGEVMLDNVRERVTLPVMRRLTERYKGRGGIKIIIQTTGDRLDEERVDELLEAGVGLISIAGIDDYHVGMEGPEKQQQAIDRLTKVFEARGMVAAEVATAERKWHEDRGWLEDDRPQYHFFGATEDSWIGKLWPRGRAWTNSLTTATIADNFCNRWAGGVNFLQHRYSGSEVSIDPEGNVFPCCIKTKSPIGNLLEENLIEILESLAGDPAFEAISMGHPERMGITEGWRVEDFLDASKTELPDGTPYQNLCIGCDRFHEQVLSKRIAEIAERRRRRRLAAAE